MYCHYEEVASITIPPISLYTTKFVTLFAEVFKSFLFDLVLVIVCHMAPFSPTEICMQHFIIVSVPGLNLKFDF